VFSRRERAAPDDFKKPAILREAVGWNTLLGRRRIRFVLLGRGKQTIYPDAITPSYGADVLF